MGNAHVFAEALRGIDAVNVKERLSALENEYGVRKLHLFNNAVDVVYMSDNELLVVKFDFLFDSDKSAYWLADEEAFPPQKPMYFSETSRRYSPVYMLQRAKMFLSLFFPASYYRVSALLLCNYYIINYDDMKEAWNALEIFVIHNLTNELDFLPESADSCQSKIGVSEQNFPDTSEDEFDRLLDEFIQANLPDEVGDEATDDLAEEAADDLAGNSADESVDKSSSSECPDEQLYHLSSPASDYFRIDHIELFRLRPDQKECPELEKSGPPLKSFNIRGLDSILVCIDAHYWYNRKPDGQFELNIYNETGQLQVHEYLCGNFLPNGMSMDVRLQFHIGGKGHVSWKKGKYLIELKYMEDRLAVAAFSAGGKNVEGALLKRNDDGNDASGSPFEALERMVGLRQVKDQIARYRDFVLLARKRKAGGLDTRMPSLHAAFLGSPGTGKTTVAYLYGAMLKELGLLSSGHVVIEERSTLMGQNYSSEQEKTLAALEKAKGGILFIDEAYSLYKPEDPKDPGRNVLDTLLTAMGDENNRDWMLLLAGYTEGMTELLSLNPGFDSRIPCQNRYYFEDYTVEEMMAIADSYCEANNYVLTAGARKALQNKVSHDYSRRNQTFGNGRYIVSLLSHEILQAMSLRVSKIKNPTLLQLMSIEKEDIPALRPKNSEKAMKKLHDMVGLSRLKQSIESHLDMVKLSVLRNEQGIGTDLPPLHMVFTGNPGTGKSTVADLIGEVYASLGLLSVGKVIRVERKDLVGSHVGETEQKTASVLKRAKGNVLFIDEAYTLCGGPAEGADFGHRALEVLLTTLSRDHIDMLVVLAGYPDDMEILLRSNPGLKSRIPYTFYFEDYTADELMEIAREKVKKMNYCFTPAALKALRALVGMKMAHRDAHWGNARFITRIITNTIIPAMSSRLLKLPPHKLADKKVLQTICRADIPLSADEALKEANGGFDESAIRRALKKLDGMVGLRQVKQSIHNFVEVARYLQRSGRSYFDKGSLRWNFTGNTGTGKSTVAGIMGELLKAMNVLEKGHLVEVKAEQLYHVSDYKADEILKSAMLRSRQGLLFIDGDAPLFRQPGSCFDSESLRFKLGSMMMELPGAYALVIAAHEPRTHTLSQSLRVTGLTEFDHTFYFEDYTEEELYLILEQCLKKRKLHLSSGAGSHIAGYIQGMCSHRELGYANARTMKLISDAIAESYWLRVSGCEDMDNGDVLWEDVKGFVWKGMPGEKRIGYK